MINRVFIFVAISILLASCVDAPEFPVEPQIEFLGLTKLQLDQGRFQNDTTFAVFSFTDGDGDLGSDDSLNIFITDTRLDFLVDRFRIPFIPEEGSGNGVEGQIRVLLFTSCCIYDTGQPPCTPGITQTLDTLVYQIYINDRAGNQSNTIETSPIILNCI